MEPVLCRNARRDPENVDRHAAGRKMARYTCFTGSSNTVRQTGSSPRPETTVPWGCPHADQPQCQAGSHHASEAPQRELVVPGPQLHAPIAGSEYRGGSVQSVEVPPQAIPLRFDTNSLLAFQDGHAVAAVGVVEIQHQPISAVVLDHGTLNRCGQR